MMRDIAAVLLLVLLGASCTDQSGGGRGESQSSFSGVSVSTASDGPRYDFAGVAAALAQRGIDLSLLRAEDWQSLRSDPGRSLRALAGVLDHHYGNLVVGMHIGRININDPRLRVHNRLTYVIEITGSPTGNCIYLYEAATGRGYVGACFYAERIHPSVRP